tara:strand:- start:704 stop:1813 length:1110 start_codon:yes stop_codon:yes gene_type:complete
MRAPLLLAVGLAILIGVWIYSGQLSNHDGLIAESEKSEVKESTSETVSRNISEGLITVRTKLLIAELYDRFVVVRGRTESVRSVHVRAELDGRIIESNIQRGSYVKQGQVIAKLDKSNREKRIAEAEATVKQRKLEHEAALELNRKGHGGSLKIAEAITLLKKAQAIASQIEKEIEATNIRAPFDGVLEERHIEIGDYVMEGQRLATVVDQNPILVVGQVSERDVDKIINGASGEVKLIDGKVLNGHIRYVASQADAATRTFRIELEVPNNDHSLRSGVSAEIHVKTSTSPAHLVSAAALTLDENGVIGVRLVNPQGLVTFHEAEIVGESSEGVWLSGLPDKVNIITVGQEYVRDGDVVRIDIETDSPT